MSRKRLLGTTRRADAESGLEEGRGGKGVTVEVWWWDRSNYTICLEACSFVGGCSGGGGIEGARQCLHCHIFFPTLSLRKPDFFSLQRRECGAILSSLFYSPSGIELTLLRSFWAYVN